MFNSKKFIEKVRAASVEADNAARKVAQLAVSANCLAKLADVKGFSIEDGDFFRLQWVGGPPRLYLLQAVGSDALRLTAIQRQAGLANYWVVGFQSTDPIIDINKVSLSFVPAEEAAEVDLATA